MLDDVFRVPRKEAALHHRVSRCGDLAARGRTVILRNWPDILAVAHAGGADALGLVWAAHDIVLDPETGPVGWPIEELIDLVARTRPGSSALLRDLRGLAREIEDFAAAMIDGATLGSAA